LPYVLYVPLAYWIFSSYGATSVRMILLQWGIYCAILSVIIASTRPSFCRLKRTWKCLNVENKRYGIQLYYGSLAMLATNYIAGITLGAFNDDNQNVGFYTLALTITSSLSVLPGIIGTTNFKQFASQDRIPSKVIRTTLYLTVASCLFFVLLINPIVDFLYPESYNMVGVYSSWMAVGFCIHGLGDMINRYLGSHGQGKQIRNASFICGSVRVIGFSALVYLWDINGAIITNIVSSALYAVTLFIYYRKYIVSNERIKI
jgi:O-antigen/teichoic acid export membrane protein